MGTYQVERGKRRFKQLMMTFVFLAVVVLGWVYPFLGYFIPLCMIAGIGIAFGRGRQWCNWYCPRGSFYDAVPGALKPGKAVAPFFKDMRVRLGVLAFLMIVMAVNIARFWPDPRRIGFVFVVMLTITTIIGIILAFVSHQRGWCHLCPIGTIGNLVGGKKFPLMIDSRQCVMCKQCAAVCPMGIRPYEYKSSGRQAVLDADCIKCGLCVSVCPKKALSFPG